MGNPDTLATLGTRDTERRQTKHKNTTQKTKKMSSTKCFNMIYRRQYNIATTCGRAPVGSIQRLE